MSRQLIGTFQLGYENVRLFAEPNYEGGSFALAPLDDGSGTLTVEIGGDCSQRKVLSILMHEAMEYVCARRKLRFRPTEKLSGDHANYLFVFDHAQFTDVVCAVAFFVNQCQYKLIVAHRKQLAKEAREKKIAVAKKKSLDARVAVKVNTAS